MDHGILIETFISSLKECIWMHLKTINPITLYEAISLAKATEVEFTSERTPYQWCDIPFIPEPKIDEIQTTQELNRPYDPLWIHIVEVTLWRK